jgi:hypothetical protein
MRQASSHIERQGLKEKAAVSDDRGLCCHGERRNAIQSWLVIVTGCASDTSGELAVCGRWIASLRSQ